MRLRRGQCPVRFEVGTDSSVDTGPRAVQYWRARRGSAVIWRPQAAHRLIKSPDEACPQTPFSISHIEQMDEGSSTKREAGSLWP